MAPCCRVKIKGYHQHAADSTSIYTVVQMRSTGTPAYLASLMELGYCDLLIIICYSVVVSLVCESVLCQWTYCLELLV